ncbi:hypothetical protein ACIA8C_08045 [Nocardia sp. NPDC051321]|uniref:hypothetical protein n=1 Tax=Nocardia sp. NPDC051321 TaxID=3364323 RepID=UPI0037B97C41
MQVTRGALLVRLDDKDPAMLRVKAVRYAPIPYAEVEPAGGGRRSTVLLAEVEREFRVEPGVLAVDG